MFTLGGWGLTLASAVGLSFENQLLESIKIDSVQCFSLCTVLDKSIILLKRFLDVSGKGKLIMCIIFVKKVWESEGYLSNYETEAGMFILEAF